MKQDADRETAQRLARLALLQLSHAEEERFARDLVEVLRAFRLIRGGKHA